MTRPQKKTSESNERPLLVALAVCCVVPMLAIIVMTSVLGVALGPAVAVSLGIIAAMVCVAVMVQHHRDGKHHEGQHHQS